MKNLIKILVILVIWFISVWVVNASFTVCLKIDDISLVCKNNQEKIKAEKFIEDGVNARSLKVWIEKKEQELLNSSLNADEREEIENNLKYYKKQLISQRKDFLSRYIWDREYNSFWIKPDIRMKEYDKMQKIRINFNIKYWKKLSNILKKFNTKKLKKIYSLINIKKQKIILDTKLSRSKKNVKIALYDLILYKIEDIWAVNDEDNVLKWLGEEF